MCELFGISSAQDCQLNGYLKEFFSHSKDHPHGWGIAHMEQNKVQIAKEPVQASKSAYLKDRLSVPFSMKNGFAHIRNATVGNVKYKNCHPYTLKDNSGRQWTMIHNGTIFEYKPLNKYIKIQNGSTDSERILLYLVELINKEEERLQKTLNEEERFHVLDSAVTEMAKGNKLNMILHDGDLFYVHTNYARSLYQLHKEDNQTLFSTTPLSKEDWCPVTFTTLLAYRQGEQVFTGTNHGTEFKDEHALRAITVH